MRRVTSAWYEKEFAGIRFRDARLGSRFFQMAKDLSEQPSSPINQACGSWKKTKAAYRFFANENVEARDILQPHVLQTVERVRSHGPWIFAIQDTTGVDYTNHPKTRGIGPIASLSKGVNSPVGLKVHTTLTITEQGLPLGILDQQIWSRPPEPAVRGSYRYKAIDQRESYKWVRALERSVESLSEAQRCQFVTVCDREADLFELMDRAIELKTHVLIRAHQDRTLRRSYAYQGLRPIYLSEVMTEQPIRGYLEVEVPEVKFIHPSRKACLAVTFREVELLAPRLDRSVQTYEEAQKKIQIFAVWVTEKDPPAGVEPIEWKLFTTVPVKTVEDAAERVKWYTLRWQIEVFHRILKSGCRVEACRLESASKLTKYLTIASVIAWKIHQMTHLNRLEPDSSCAVVLSESEWKSLCIKNNPENPLPRKPPSIRDALRWIAQLGGFLGRKSDGEPGPTTLWRGWQRLSDLSEMYSQLRPTKTCG